MPGSTPQIRRSDWGKDGGGETRKEDGERPEPKLSGEHLRRSAGLFFHRPEDAPNNPIQLSNPRAAAVPATVALFSVAIDSPETAPVDDASG